MIGFFQLRAMIHFSDPIVYEDDDPLKKLRYLLDSFSNRFKEIYQPEEYISVDEYLSLWTGRLRFRIYIPTKRERYGVKIFMICESASGYLLDFIIYTGSSTVYRYSGPNLPKTFEEYKSPSKVVLSLIEPYLNKGYKLAVDNYYTSPELLKALLTVRTDAYGTLRNKEGLLKDFWNWKPVKGDPPIVKYAGDIMLMRWNDNNKEKTTKIVSMMSTIHIGEVIDSGKLNRNKDVIYKPDVIVLYNKTMGGVDTLSRVLIPYSSQGRRLKW